MKANSNYNTLHHLTTVYSSETVTKVKEGMTEARKQINLCEFDKA